MYRVLTITIPLLITACGSGTIKPLAQPDWINNPGHGAVGSSTTHVRGRHYQEDLAISRAREKLAAQLGVEINSVQTIKEKVVNDKSYVTSDKQTGQSIKNKEVKAYVRATWHDTRSDELWVWVYPVD